MDKTQIKHIVHAISGVEIIINTETQVRDWMVITELIFV